MVNRYNFELFHCNGGDMTPDAQGEYVSYEDYQDRLIYWKEIVRLLQHDFEKMQKNRDRWVEDYKHLIEQHMPRTTDGCQEGWSRVIEAQELQQKLDQVNEKLSRYSMSAGQADQFAAEAKLVRKALGFSEDAQDVAPIDLLEKINAMSAENASLKSNLMFWDAEDPEAPYDCPKDIANNCCIDVGVEFDVKVAARMPDRTYRVSHIDDWDCVIELVSGGEIETPATHAYLNSVRAEGLKMAIDHMNNQTSDDCADVTVLPVMEMYKKLTSSTYDNTHKGE